MIHSCSERNLSKKIIVSFFFFACFTPFSSLANFSNQNRTAKTMTAAEITTYKYSFSQQDHFIVSYADYPRGQEDFYELAFEEGALLPLHIKPSCHGLKISGNNHSDDLFMYTYKQLNGLKANTTYHVSFSLELASNAPIDSTGVGGSPGSSVYVKIGAVTQKPDRYIDNAGYYRMKLDKGDQALDGKDMLLIGTVGVDTHDEIYRIKTLPYQPTTEMHDKLEHYTVTTDEKGMLWLIVGTDSGYESTSTLFYTNVIASFKEVLS